MGDIDDSLMVEFGLIWARVHMGLGKLGLFDACWVCFESSFCLGWFNFSKSVFKAHVSLLRIN